MNVGPQRDGSHGERGIALISALLILVLLAIAGATFMNTTSGERSIASNVQMSRASLLAADAGVRTGQQVLANMGKAKLDSLLPLWPGPGTAIIPAPNNLFPVGPLAAVTSTNPNFTFTASIAWADSEIRPSFQSFNFNYTITSTGSSGAYGQRQVQSSGVLRVSATRGTFADYLIYTNVHLTPSGSPIWFTSSSQFDGRVHTNGEFRFAYQPGFQDLVTSVNSKAWYYNNNNPVEKAANSNGTIDVPDFFGGFTRSVGSVPLPTNSYNQQNAALGPPLSPTSGTAPTNSQINTAIGSGAGTGTPPNGIYLVTSGSSVTGGIYVQGTLDQLKAVADTVAHKQQYILKQGATTKTITVDYGANTTTLTVGASNTTYSGVPQGCTYVNGTLSDLRGPDRSGSIVPPAIEAHTQMLFAATGDIIIQRDMTCQDYETSDNVVGIYSSGGNVRVGTSAPNDMNLDAFVMAAGTNSAFQVDNYSTGSPRGTFHLRGGAVQYDYGPFYTFNTSGVLQTGFARDFHYDRRGNVPPFYPTTVQFNADSPSARTLAWKEI